MCAFIALECCMLIPGMCRADDGRQEAFLDAQMLVDGWEASYCHIDSLKVSCTRILVDEKGQNPIRLQQIQFMHHERIQDGTKFLSRFAPTAQGFNNGADYLINSFDGSIGREYIYKNNHGDGSICRGLCDSTTEDMNLLAKFLQTNPLLSAKPVSEKDPLWKVKLRQQYPLGIPVFLDKYNVALKFGEVKVRPQLEYVAGEACHVLELDLISRIETFWFAHEKGMLPMKTMYVSSPDRVPGKVVTREVKEIASVATETGILWYPRVIMEEHTRGPDYSFTIKVTVDEFVPHFKAPPETFSYVFPSGTRVWDKIQNLKYIAGPSSPKVSESLMGKSLPELDEFGIGLSAADANDKAILICFFDMEQRPSWHCIMELTKRAEELKEKGVIIITVQVSKIDQAKLDEWVKENNIPFPVGMIESDEEKTRFNWGVRSLPWLILTDEQHIVRAEGFSVNELDEKITASGKR